MPDSNAQHRYPIRTVSEMTGVNSVTLRAWERRYGLIKPLRTAKGHRVYTDEHIELINTVCDRLNAGMSISNIASQLLETTSAANEEQDVWDGYLQRMLASIQQFDERGLDVVYNEANSIYPVDVVTNMLVVPLLRVIGERWSDSAGSVAEEHFFSVYLRNKIGARFHHQNNQDQGKSLIAACLPGEMHEFGLLLFALSAHSRGYHIVLLGADMPIEELPEVARIANCDGIVLTGSAHIECSELNGSLLHLKNETSVPIFIGGDVIEQCHQKLLDTGLHSLGKDITSGVSIISHVLSNNSKR